AEEKNMPAIAATLSSPLPDVVQKNVTRVVAGVFMVACAAGSETAAAQQPSAGTVVITGRLINQDSSPVSNARIVISSAGEIATTDSGGRFVIPRMPAGAHAIEIWHENASTIQIPRLNLPAGDTV